MLGILGVIAEFERETIKGRTQDGREQAINKGVIMGTSAPYRYKKSDEKTRLILKQEADVVRRIFDMFVHQKKSTYQIAVELKRTETLSPEVSAMRNKKSTRELRKKTDIHFWRPEVVLRILKDDIYIGNLYAKKFQRGKVNPASEWKLLKVKAPVIVDKLTFQKAQKIVQLSKRERKSTHSGHTYLLSGLLSCDYCSQNREAEERTHWIGERKQIKKEDNRYTYYYKCGRRNPSKTDIICSTLPLPAAEIENYIKSFCEKLITNPIAVYQYQRDRKSTKQNLAHLEKQEADILKKVNEIPNRKKIIAQMTETSMITLKEAKERMAHLNEAELQFNKKLQEINVQLAELVISEEYEKALNIFSKKYKDGLDKVFASKEATYDLFHKLIEEIIVYSRIATAEDKIAGRKRPGQAIPFRIHLKLKLPADFLAEVSQNLKGKEDGPEMEFGVKKYQLSG